MQGIFRKENTDKALKYGIYRHLPTYEKIIRNLVSFFEKIFIFYIPSGYIQVKGYKKRGFFILSSIHEFLNYSFGVLPILMNHIFLLEARYIEMDISLF